MKSFLTAEPQPAEAEEFIRRVNRAWRGPNLKDASPHASRLLDREMRAQARRFRAITPEQLPGAPQRANAN